METILGQPQPQLDQAAIVQLCLERQQEFRQKKRNDMRSKLEEIQRNAAIISPDGPSNSPELPYDIWETILVKYITEPKDIKMLWEISGLFREILRRKYIQIVFPEIIKLMWAKRPRYFVPDYYYQTSSESPVLHCRLLSKLCKKTVEDSFYSAFWEDQDRSSYPVTKVESTADLQALSSMIASDNFNADKYFVGLLVIIEPIDEIDILPFRQAVAVLLGLVGRRIRFFQFVSFLRSSEQIYNLICEWVALMPHVEHLWLGKWGSENDVPPTLDNIQPFPICSSLRSYRECCTYVLPAPYIQRILEANSVTELRLFEMYQVREHSPQVLEEALVDVTTLQIFPFSALFDNHHLPWKKLNKLRIGHLYDSTKVMTSSSKLFPFLKQFEEHLEHLEIWIDVTQESVEEDYHYLELCKLKTFKWKQHQSFRNVHFLLYAKRLEDLYVRAAERNTKAEMCIDFAYRSIVGEESGSFFGESIWKVLPYLNRIQVGGKGSFGREVSLEKFRNL